MKNPKVGERVVYRHWDETKLKGVVQVVDQHGLKLKFEGEGSVWIVPAHHVRRLVPKKKRERTYTEAEVGALKRSSKALVDKLRLIHANEEYQSVWTVAQLHRGKYSGPMYSKELAELDLAISQVDAGER